MPQRNSREDWGGPSRYNHSSRERDVRRARLREEELEAELDDYMLEESSSPRLREPHSRREERYFGNSPRRKEFRYSEERKRERSGRYGGRSESSEWREYGSPQRRTDKARSKTDAALEIAARLNKKYERKPSRSISPRRRSSHHRWQDSRSPSPRRKRRYRSSSRSSSRSPSRRYSYDRRKSGRRDRDWDRSHENRGRRFSHSDDNRSKQYGRHRRSGEYHADKPDDAFMSVPPPPPPPPPVVPPPPLEEYPRSPDITDRLEYLATSQDVAFDHAKGIDDVELFQFRLSQMELDLLGPKPKSWEEQEEQCRLLVLRYGLQGAEDDDKEPFSSDEFKEYFSRPGRTGEEIPYEQRSPIEDPRRQFTKEYEFMTAWAGKPRPLPGFVNDTVFKQQNGDQSPTLSWSTSPARAGSPAKQKTQRPEPKPQTKISMSNRPSTGGKNASVPRDLNLMDGKHSTMELEEGYFCVKLLNGQDVMLQYDEIVDLIKKGSLPDDWPAFRESDSLWIAVSAKDDQAADLQRHDNAAQENKPAPLGKSIWLSAKKATPDIRQIKSWFQDAAKQANRALASRGGATLQLQYTRSSLMDCRRLTQQAPTREFEFENESKLASESINHQQRIVKLRRSARIRARQPRKVSPSTLAMIKGHILMDRTKLKEIGTVALQRAIKAFKERQNK
ncbi:hypothetical protein M9435_001052 [Picochlorum sp. BPE23]|nr:hypothetical protein M9435_001052 [Picochlorum sp. BPE23]